MLNHLIHAAEYLPSGLVGFNAESAKKQKKKRVRHNSGAGARFFGLSTGQAFDVLDVGNDLIRGTANKSSMFGWPVLGLGLADVSISTATAGKGKKVAAGSAAVAAQAVGLAAFSSSFALGAGAGQALIPIPGVGAFIGGVVGGLGSQLILDHVVRKAVFRGINAVVNGRPLVKFGGFKDSQQAYTMRQQADIELRTSRMAARRYLGKEAQLMHQ